MKFLNLEEILEKSKENKLISNFAQKFKDFADCKIKINDIENDYLELSNELSEKNQKSLEVCYARNLLKNKKLDMFLSILKPKESSIYESIDWKYSKKFYNSIKLLQKFKGKNIYGFASKMFNVFRSEKNSYIDYNDLLYFMDLRTQHAKKEILKEIQENELEYLKITLDEITKDYEKEKNYMIVLKNNKQFFEAVHQNDFPGYVDLLSVMNLTREMRDLNCGAMALMKNDEINYILKEYIKEKDEKGNNNTIDKIIDKFNNKDFNINKIKMNKYLFYKIIDSYLGPDVRRKNHNIKEAYEQHLKKYISFDDYRKKQSIS